MLQMPEDTKNVREETGNVEPSLVSLSRKCSNCGQTGHNSRTCLEVREPTASEAEHKSHTGDSNTTQAPLQHTELQQDGTARDEDAEASDCSGGGCRESKKKGVAWTEDEHKLFLQGLQKLGKGDWRGISRQFVQTRSPTQVASHAQKFFIRQSVVGKRKRRSSLFDLVPEGMQEVKDQSAVSMERSKLAPETAARPSSENLPQPGAVLPPLAQGAEAFAVACWYQSMMLQQCWMQSMFSQPHPPNFGAIPIPPGPQPTNLEGSVPSSENSASFFRDQQILASLAAEQHAAAFSAQQQLSAFMGKQGGPPEQSWPLGNDIPEMVFKAMRSSLPNLPGKEAAKHRVDEREQQQRGENPPPEVFGNGRLVKPKAHRAQSVQSLGSVPSYMMTSQSEGNPQLTSSSKDSQDSLARLCGLSGAADPSSYTGGIGSTLAFNASSHLEKSTASEGSRTLKHLIPE